jgi:hypothetical protein
VLVVFGKDDGAQVALDAPVSPGVAVFEIHASCAFGFGSRLDTPGARRADGRGMVLTRGGNTALFAVSDPR